MHLPVELPPTTLIKIKHYDKSDNAFVKIKLCRDLTSEKSEFYEFKMALLDNNNPEEFLLFVCNFNMNIKASGTFNIDAKIQ